MEDFGVMLVMHSHSGLERQLSFPKNRVLVDKKWGERFDETELVPFTHNDIEYWSVPILSFLKHGGVFKNMKS